MKVLSILLLSVSVACSRAPERIGHEFLLALQEHRFEDAANLATIDTATIVLFMAQMIDVNKQEFGGYENLDIRLPQSGKEIEYLSTSEEDGYLILEFSSGMENFIIYGIEVDREWKIHLPRTSW